MLHLSPGLGTTFVPFRFLARPEATELVLQSRADGARHRPDRSDAAHGADRVPRVHLVAVAGGRTIDKRRWIEKTEDEWGAWGTVYCDADGRLLGSMQYGPAVLFPRA